MQKIIDKFWLFAENHDALLHMFLYGLIVTFTIYVNIQWIKMISSISDLQSKAIKSQGELINLHERQIDEYQELEKIREAEDEMRYG
jgi:hypothetical protein